MNTSLELFTTLIFVYPSASGRRRPLHLWKKNRVTFPYRNSFLKMLRIARQAGLVGVRSTTVNGWGASLSRSAQQVAKVNMSTQITPFLLADIGEGIAEVELMQWFVKEGDVIKSFDRICEVQSDKATVEITSRYDGKVAKVHFEEGAIVPVGAALVDMLTSADVSAPKAKLGDDSTPKLSVPEAPKAVAPEAAPSPAPVSSGFADLSDNDKVKATPAVRKIAKENNIDLRTVSASGPQGRVLKEDILAYLQGGARAVAPAAGSGGATFQPPAATFTPPVVMAEDERIPIRGVARLMVKSMQAAQTVQHLTLMEEVTMDEMVALRSTLKSSAEKQGLKLSYMPFIIKAASMALQQYPQLNSTVNADVTEVVRHASHNIGVAMDTPNGLMVPVIKAVQTKSIFELAAEMMSLQEKGAAGKLTEKDLQGGTFTLTNIGSIGGTYATPVLVVPQVAIGAFGRLQVLPRYVGENGKPATPADVANGKATSVPATVMNISWSADHRVVDGATVARFNNVWRGYMEEPSTMMSNMR